MKFYILITALLTCFTTNMLSMESKTHAAAAQQTETKVLAAAQAGAGSAADSSSHHAQVALDQQAQQAHQDELKKVRGEYALGQKYFEGTSVAKNFKIAAGHFQVAAEQIIDRGLKAEALNQLGSIYHCGDRYLPQNNAQAIKYFKQALIAAHLIDPTIEIRALFNLGLCYKKRNPLTAQGYFEQALPAFKALSTYLKIQVQHLEAHALLELGIIHYNYNLNEARNYFEKALKAPGITAEIKHHAQHNSDFVYYKLGVDLYNHQDITAAIHHLVIAQQSTTQRIRDGAIKKMAEIRGDYQRLYDFRAVHTACVATNSLVVAESMPAMEHQPVAEKASAARGTKRTEHPVIEVDDDNEDENETGSTKEPAAKRTRKEDEKDVSGKDAKKN